MNGLIRLVLVVVVLSMLPLAVRAQSAQGENIDLYVPDVQSQFASDSLWLGGVFLRDTTKPLLVRLYFQETGCSGNLYFMIPGAGGRRDSALFLFRNYDPVGTQVDLTQIAKLYGLGYLDTIAFMYRPTCLDNDPNYEPCKPEYTGPNRRVGDQGYTAYDRYSSDELQTYLLQRQTYPAKRRWCVAGWIPAPGTSDVHSDTVEFGFEDWPARGDDFNDIVFHVSGVYLNVPPVVDRLSIAVSDTSIIAGGSVALPVLLLTDRGRLVPIDSVVAGTGELVYNRVTWQILPVDLRTGDSLSVLHGQSVTFSGTAAFRTRRIVATYRDPGGALLRDTATVYVAPGPDFRVWVEAQSATPIASPASILPGTYADSITPRPIDVVRMDSSQNSAYAYAVVRDRFGNIKRAATYGLWQDLPPPGAVTVAAASGKLWEGVISRSGSGDDSLRVWENAPLVLIPDTVKVVISGGVLTALRIVDTNGNVVSAVTITTDQVQYLRVEGQWSDKPGQWSEFPAFWSMSVAIPSANALPSQVAAAWTFSPTSPGETDLTVRNEGGSRSATVHLVVTPAPPSRVEIRLIDSSPRAGTPFRAQVQISNSDGLVPGPWCYPGNMPGQVAYQDEIMKSGQAPLVSTAYDSDTLNLRMGAGPLDTAEQVSECFANGTDTVSFTLYFAPLSNDSNHRLWVRMYGASGYIEGATDPFHLLPGPVDSIYLTDGNGVPLPASMTLDAPTGLVFAQSMGVDAWGNSIGPVPSTWTGTGTLHAPTPGPSSGQYYTTTGVTAAETGCVVAVSATGTGDPGAGDSVCLDIAAPPAHVLAAITRDTSGNGLLDRIEVHFSKTVTISDTLPVSNIAVTYRSRTGAYSLAADNLLGRNGTFTDSVFYVNLVESHPDLPQTGWVPSIRFSVSGVVSTEVACSDGAGPVIWKVSKHVESAGDPSKDVVTVTFSEELDRTPGASDDPGNVFCVWVRNSDGTFRNVDTLLDGVDYFLASSAKNESRFQMLNGQNLTENNWLSIRVTPPAPPPVIDDAVAGNAPNANNRKAQVQVDNPKLAVQAAPNPMIPNASRPNDRSLTYNDPSQVAQWAYRENGMAFMVSVPLPSDNTMTLEGELMVYDVAGNLVHYRSSNGPMDLSAWRSNWQGGTTQRFGVYWNGVNDQGMKVRPGVYRGLLKLTARYRDQSGASKATRLSSSVAIGVRR